MDTMKNFREISAMEFSARPAALFHLGWTLIAAGTREKFNAMTASWGGLGCMWGLPTAAVVIRPQRFTKSFVDAQERFSLSFPPKEFKPQMAYLGKVSGRDEDKIGKSGLTPVFDEATGTPFFAEADIVMICRKLFAQPMREDAFLEKPLLEKYYPARDLHTLYIAEIEKVLTAL